MTQFASAAMCKVLRQGMLDLGLDPTLEQLPTKPDQSALVDLDTKRRLVRSAVEQGGLGCLVLLGRGLHRYLRDPTHTALTGERSVAELWTRWQRLERYIHSAHRIRVVESSNHHASIHHIALAGEPRPLVAEDLVVLGVLAALLESIGAQQVRVEIAEAEAYPAPDVAAIERLAANHQTAQWQFSWGALASRARATVSDLPQDMTKAELWPDIAQTASGLLVQDLMSPPRLPDLAQALNVAPRSLQRTLAQAGLSYSGLLAECRRRAAAWRLMETSISLAEIGFLCGYSDQAHFTRDFRDTVGLPPAKYREAFGLSSEVKN
jgi:AraC-like DNA-binding protein